MNTISASEAANRTRRAMALRDLMVEVGWDADKAARMDDSGWDALARTIAARTGRPFRSPSPATRDQAIGLLRGELTTVPVAVAASPAGVRTTPPAADVTGRIGLNGRSRVATNVSAMVD